MGKQILFEEEAKTALRNGVNKVADAVGSTMGPGGRTVIIRNRPMVVNGGQVVAQPPIVTKDGVTVAANIILDDEIEDIGAQMVRRASETTYYDAGDGTTQTAFLAQSIITQGLDAVANGANPMEVKRGIEKAVDTIVLELKEMSTDIGDDNEMIRKIATTSANNDSAIGDLIADAYKKIGKNGLLLMENSATIHTEIEVIEGYEMPRGYISPDFATNDKKRAILNNALVLVTDYSINTMKEIENLLMLLQKANMLGSPLLIVAQDYDGEFYSSMLMNHHKGILRNCLVKSPAAYKREHLEDIAAMTGATVIRDEYGLKLQSIELKHLGSAEKIIVSEYTTLVIGGGGKKDKIDELKATVQVQMEEHKDEEIKKIWEKRLAKINGSIGIIKVGAPTDVEQKEKLARVDDALRAVKSSVEEGVVVGGGVALLRASMAPISGGSILEGDEKVGQNIVDKACEAPLAKMLKNAGLDEKILGEICIKEQNVGYNIKKRMFENLFDSGILDPTKVTRCALQNAASVAGAIITSHCMVVEIAKK
jgi:chaperonin GroEL